MYIQLFLTEWTYQDLEEILTPYMRGFKTVDDH